MEPWVFLVVAVVLGCGCTRHHHLAPTPVVPRSSAAKSDHPAAPDLPAIVTPAPATPTSRDTLIVLTGCLGGSNGTLPYRLTDEKGQGIAVGGIKDLDNHVGHTVKLTGRATGTGFNASTVEDLAPTCTPPR